MKDSVNVSIAWNLAGDKISINTVIFVVTQGNLSHAAEQSFRKLAPITCSYGQMLF